LPRGNTLSDDAWRRRHRLLQVILLAHLPGLFLFGLWRGVPAQDVAEVLAVPAACLALGRLMRSRRAASIFVTFGLVYCSAALVGLSHGSIEAHFHFFVMIGFIALYQDWVPFLMNIVFTVLSHGIGSSLVPGLMFNHFAAQSHPWTWSVIHGVAVLAACVGVVLFWKNTEEEQNRSLRLTRQLSEAELGRRRFTSELLVNLARRNQNLLHRQLDLLNQLEEKEHDPDALSDLFRLDHLATRIRRNAESLLVLSGEETPRTWRSPVPLVDVVRAAIAEIEDLDRVDFAVEEALAVSGRAVADLTHLLAELLENAVHFSPPGAMVMLRTRPVMQSPGAQVVTIEDWGVGMTSQELADADDLLHRPREVDLSVSQRLGLHVVARLAQRYAITVNLTATPGGGVTAVAVLPARLFAEAAPGAPPAGRGPAGRPGARKAAVGGHAGAVGAGGLAGTRDLVGAEVAGAGPAGPVGTAGLTAPASHHDAALVGSGQSLLAGATVTAALPPLPRRSPGGHTPRPDPDGQAGPVRTLEPAGGSSPSAPDDDRWSSWWTPLRPPHAGHSPGPSTPDAGTGRRAEASRTGSRPDPVPAGGIRPDPPPAGGMPGGPVPAGGMRPGPVPASGTPANPMPAGALPADPPAAPAAPAAPGAPVDDVSDDVSDGGPRLSQRVPQAHLAPGLRREAGAAADSAPAILDPLAARDALSRFQASQRAAREVVGDGPTSAGPGGRTMR
ncbi:MAG TPA: ATP-binding protein, partial [Mycobacteriales bacterium]|nr:ATP-binding protein [Mycobacteriales bacterium]